MVQLKYFGDNRDYFKYDLISFVLSKNIFASYCFVPMLTKHRTDREGEVALKPSTCKSTKLFNFIKEHENQDLNHWEKWLKQFVPIYKTIQPVNYSYFADHDRSKYWEINREILVSDNAFIFVDPDTGLQAGRKSCIKKTDKEKYILNDDLFCLLNYLSDSSMYIIYQHLQRNRHNHVEDIERKIRVLGNFYPNLFVTIYYEDDLAFVFATKRNRIYHQVNKTIAEYHFRSSIEHRGVHKTSFDR